MVVTKDPTGLKQTEFVRSMRLTTLVAEVYVIRCTLAVKTPAFQGLITWNTAHQRETGKILCSVPYITCGTFILAGICFSIIVLQDLLLRGLWEKSLLIEILLYFIHSILTFRGFNDKSVPTMRVKLNVFLDLNKTCRNKNL